VDDDHSVFTPDIINDLNANTEEIELPIIHTGPAPAISITPNIVDVILEDFCDEKDCRGEQDFCPFIHCLRGILDNETMVQYSHISEIDIMHTESIMEGTMPSGIRFLE